jgi:hypothetical protein
MWSLWVVPLIGIIFVAVALTSLVLLCFKKFRSRRWVAGLLAAPFGCAALPLLLVMGLVGIANLTKQSDAQLYEEIFGYQPAITEDRMLANASGSDASREIYMRIEPTTAELARLMHVPNLRQSSWDLETFKTKGDSKGFTWWVWSKRQDRMDPNYCPEAEVFEAPGFRGWREFRLAKCDVSQNSWKTDFGLIFVMAIK